MITRYSSLTAQEQDQLYQLQAMAMDRELTTHEQAEYERLIMQSRRSNK